MKTTLLVRFDGSSELDNKCSENQLTFLIPTQSEGFTLHEATEGFSEDYLSKEKGKKTKITATCCAALVWNIFHESTAPPDERCHVVARRPIRHFSPVKGTLWAIKAARAHTSVVACTWRDICTCIVFHISFRISSASFAHRFIIFASSFSLLVILCLCQVSLEIFSIFSFVSCSFVLLCGHELVPCARSFPLQFGHLLSLLSVITSPISL